MTEKTPDLMARLDAFYAAPSADCISTDRLQVKRQALMVERNNKPEGVRAEEITSTLVSIDRVLSRRAAQMTRERVRG